MGCGKVFLARDVLGGGPVDLQDPLCELLQRRGCASDFRTHEHRQPRHKGASCQCQVATPAPQYHKRWSEALNVPSLNPLDTASHAPERTLRPSPTSSACRCSSRSLCTKSSSRFREFDPIPGHNSHPPPATRLHSERLEAGPDHPRERSGFKEL